MMDLLPMFALTLVGVYVLYSKLRFSKRKEDEYEDKRQTGAGLFLMKKIIER